MSIVTSVKMPYNHRYISDSDILNIVSRVQLFTFVVKPASSLVITRQLYNIVSLRAIDGPTKAQVCCALILIHNNLLIIFVSDIVIYVST
jgi:hypothetical protein